jgi:hypothetical protein
MTLLYQATNVRAPQYRTKDSDGSSPMAFSSQILFVVDATSRCHPLPERFWGKIVRIHSTVDMQFLFSDNAAQNVDTAVVATLTGAVSTDLGGKCLADQPRECRVPTPPPDVGMYFARRAGGAGEVLIELASD